MMENEQEDRNEGPPRKRLLTDPNPKGSFVTASLESTVSSDSSSDRFAKKTRELPNLSDCHSCAVRINCSNPRERLQPLDSMWRVVLLCKKCTKLVKSSELCPYCFSAVVDDKDCFKCRDCQHSIHKDCVAKYGSGLGFSVCVDCWVPDAVANSILGKKSKGKKKNKESCDQAATLPESTVSVRETNKPNLLGKEVEIKVAAASKAGENALRKAVIAKNCVKLAKGMLNVVANSNLARSCEKKIVDDAELAYILHRAINSSPRTSRYACLMMSSCTSDNAQMKHYSRRRISKKTSLMNSASLGVPSIFYSRRRGKGSLRNSITADSQLMYYSRRGSSSKACSLVKDCESFICKPSERIDRHVSVSFAGYAENSSSGIRCQGNDMEPHRYLLKYHRIQKGTQRPSVFVKDSDCGSCMESDNFGNGEICENCDKNANRFMLKYKRSVKCKPKFSCKVEDFSRLLSSNYPQESTSLSDTM